jgi:hypothetical protein
MRKEFSDKFFRLIDLFKIYAWHWLPSTGKSGGILCGIKKERFDIIKVEEKEFAIVAEVQVSEDKCEISDDIWACSG